jgi:hypothetical protein
MERPKVTREQLLQSSPWLPPSYELADVDAVRALSNGVANKDQQLRALQWILGAASDRLGMSYFPGGEEGRRNTDFMEGRRFVGNQIVKLINTDPTKIKPKERRADPVEPKS